MARTISLRSTLILALFICALAAPAAFAQKDKKKNSDTQDVMERPRAKKEEVKKIYREWPDKDVAYIITNAERDAYKKLATDDEREQFIEGFWQRRDPDPDTDENEYKEQYYERIAYANEHYASGIPGWKTDRGRIYITFGKPDSVESHPTGGSYDRPSYHGGGSTTTYPFETWFYRYIEGVGSGIEIEFVDPTGTGEYRIARSPDEKDALAMVPGAGLTLSEQLGRTSKADRITSGSSGYQREQDSPFSRLQLIADLSRPPVIKNAELASLLTGSGTIEDNPLNFDMRIDFYRQSDERVVTAFTIQTENKELTFADVGGVQTARMNIFGRITSVAGRRVGVFEDAVTTTASGAELLDMKNRKSAYGKTVPLAPGTYRVDVIVRDINSGATQVKHLGFTVPRYDAKQLSTSTLVLAAKLQSMSDAPAVGQFTIGQFKVIPNVARIYRKGEPVGLYLQVYNAGIDQTTLRPSVDVDYVLLKDGKELGKMPEDWRGMSDAGQRLTLARMITTDQLAPGEYELAVRIKDRVSGQALSPSEKFTVVQ
ncbi:MAG TPA: GWxTD domain-containing protein [Pyrinomonadaceae bacterium]|jgi:GWxTD domain-containing protein|nr:GWxTD domain-containing protein [Pyrinomonadaceae bacterium]